MPSRRFVYERLLLLYPKMYRKKYGPQIVQTMEDVLDNEPSIVRKVGLWIKEIVVLPGNVVEQHMVAIAGRGGLAPSMLVGWIALSLLVPFFVAMAADELSERFYNQHLYGSWFWSKPMLMLWVVVLPLLSLFISLVTYLLLVLRTSIRAGRVILLIKKSWLVIAVGLLSASLLCIVVFYDSAHCWIGKPVPALGEAVWCAENAFLNSDKE